MNWLRFGLTLLLPACVVHTGAEVRGTAAVDARGDGAGTGGSASAPAAPDWTADQCVAVLDQNLDRVLTQPDEYRDDPNIEGVQSVLAVTLLGEVADRDPRVRERFVGLLSHDNEKVRRQVLRFMATHDPAAWRAQLIAQLEAPTSRARAAALDGLVGETAPEILTRTRAAAERELAAGRIPWSEARILSAARDGQSRSILERAWQRCPKTEPDDYGPPEERDRWSQCAEIAVYLHGMGGPLRLARDAVDGPGMLRQARAVVALGLIEPELALPHLRHVLARPEPSLAVTFAAPTAHRLGLHTDPVIVEHVRRWAQVDNNWLHEMPHYLPDGDPLAIRRLVEIAEAQPGHAAKHAVELIRRGSEEGHRLVPAAWQGSSSTDSYLANFHVLPYHLRSLPGERIDQHLEAMIANRDLPHEERLGAALVRAQRGPVELPTVVTATLEHGASWGYDPYDTMLAAATCVATTPR